MLNTLMPLSEVSVSSYSQLFKCAQFGFFLSIVSKKIPKLRLWFSVAGNVHPQRNFPLNLIIIVASY